MEKKFLLWCWDKMTALNYVTCYEIPRPRSDETSKDRVWGAGTFHEPLVNPTEGQTVSLGEENYRIQRVEGNKVILLPLNGIERKVDEQ